MAAGRRQADLRAQRPRRREGHARACTRTTWRHEKARPSPARAISSPSFSPDGKYIAATKTSAFGTDVVILDVANGRGAPAAHRRRSSWAPVWSRRGNQIAYLHDAGQLVDLRLAQLEGSGPTWTVEETRRPHLQRRPRRRVAARLVRPEDQPGAARHPSRPRRTGASTGAVGDPPTSSGSRARTAVTRSVLCVGIDPEATSLPAGFPATLAGVERFARLVLEARLPSRPRSSPTSRSSRRTDRRGSPPSSGSAPCVPADVPFVADAKRGDIGTTAARQAAALFDALGADAVTVNPYLGEEAVGPLLERLDRFAYVLCRTSNPGAAGLQGLEVPASRRAASCARPLWARVARRAAASGPGGTVGLVVGATGSPCSRAGGRRRAVGEHGVDLAALGADARDEEGQAGAIERGWRASSAGAVAPTTSPTVPPGPQQRRARATRARGLAGRRLFFRGDRPGPGSAAPGLDVRHRTANRSARSSRGAIASSPRYGLTVTASAPRAS